MLIVKSHVVPVSLTLVVLLVHTDLSNLKFILNSRQTDKDRAAASHAKPMPWASINWSLACVSPVFPTV